MKLSDLTDDQKIELYTFAKKKYTWASDASLKHICKILYKLMIIQRDTIGKPSEYIILNGNHFRRDWHGDQWIYHRMEQGYEVESLFENEFNQLYKHKGQENNKKV